MSTAYADQVAAARRQGAALQATLAALATIRRPTTTEDTPGAARWGEADTIPGCRHVSSPVPIFGLLARPGLAYCPACGADALARHVKAHPHTCDGCGRRGRIFHEAAVVVPPFVTLVGNLCPACTTGHPQTPGQVK